LKRDKDIGYFALKRKEKPISFLFLCIFYIKTRNKNSAFSGDIFVLKLLFEIQMLTVFLIRYKIFLNLWENKNKYRGYFFYHRLTKK